MQKIFIRAGEDGFDEVGALWAETESYARSVAEGKVINPFIHDHNDGNKTDEGPEHLSLRESSQEAEMIQVDKHHQIVSATEQAPFQIAPKATGNSLLIKDTNVEFDAFKEAQLIKNSLCLKQVCNDLFIFDAFCHKILDDNHLRALVAKFLLQKFGTVKRRLLEDCVYFLKIPEEQAHEKHINKDIVAFKNGWLSCRDFLFSVPNPQTFVLHGLNCHYNSSLWGQCPHMIEFIDYISGGVDALKKRAWQIIAAQICNYDLKAFIACIGRGDAGKSLFLKIIQALFSPEDSVSLLYNQLASRFDTSIMFGKKLCVCADMPQKPISNGAVSVIKMITGSDEMTCEAKYQSRKTFFKDGLRLICASNFPIKIIDADPAFERRMVCLAFPYPVPREKQNPHLLNLLIAEREAIVATALTYLPELMDNNFAFAGEEETSQLLIAMYGEQFSKTASEALNNFIDSCIRFDDPESFVSSDKLFAAFSQRFPGVISNSSALSKKLGEEFEKRGIMTAVSHRSKTGKRERGYMGISLV